MGFIGCVAPGQLLATTPLSGKVLRLERHSRCPSNRVLKSKAEEGVEKARLGF